MLNFKAVTYYFEAPVTGTVRNGDKYASWEISEVTFNFVCDTKPQPPSWLVFKCHQELRDADGNEIPVEILSLLDLDRGMDEAFRREFGAAWDAIEGDE